MLESTGIAMNFATLAGHGNIRASVMGYSSGRPGPEEMLRMKALLTDTLDAGAIGLSSGLIYPPGMFAEIRELFELVRYGRELSGENFIYASHIRSEGDSLIEALGEIVGIAKGTGARGHVSHIKTLGRENWAKVDSAIALLDDALAAGVCITCDRYPYTASSTDLDSVLPAWAIEGGRGEELRRLKDAETRTRITEEIKADDDYWRSVFVSTVASEKNTWMQGLSILDISSRMGIAPEEAVLRVIVEEDLQVGAIFHSMSEDNLKRFLSLPYLMIGSDSSARSFRGPTALGKPHPRGFGSFPRFIRRYSGGLPEAIRKITSLPAETFGLNKRGLLKEGYRADIVVFDPEEITDRATFDEPFVPPLGIRHVFVNGRPVVLDSKPTGQRPGKVLRNGG
jgi:N-acyl-D-amino-acid deacylase